MKINYKKILLVAIFTVLSAGVFFCLHTEKIYGLEVIYPPIPGSDATVPAGDVQLPQYIKYMFLLGVGLGVASAFISLGIAGVMYIVSPAFPSGDFLARAKDRAVGAIAGLIILILTYQIITLLFGNFALNLNELSENPAQPAEKKLPGVYFYKGGDCSDQNVTPDISSISDLGNMKNRVNSAKIERDYENNKAYISIVYSNPSFRGQCQYISPDGNCNAVTIPAESASIYEYDFSPRGEGVTFYRRSFFDVSGGSFKLSNSKIGGMYIGKLEDLKFEDVPEKEQTCTMYKKDGECEEGARMPPTLAGENILSIKTNGNYLVVLSYAAPGQECESIINKFCQEFSTQDDVNKKGPVQIKWEQIRNNGGVLPNCVMIMPIKKN